MGAKNLIQELVELGLKNEKTGLVLIDNLISDALNEERMATPAELAEIKLNLNKRKEPKLILIKNPNIID